MRGARWCSVAGGGVAGKIIRAMLSPEALKRGMNY